MQRSATPAISIEVLETGAIDPQRFDHAAHIFRSRNEDLFARGESSVLDRCYKRETLASTRARQVFVLPDRREDRPAG